nr:immunoglobulin light chain junction region [Macaca mulatta]
CQQHSGWPQLTV